MQNLDKFTLCLQKEIEKDKNKLTELTHFKVFIDVVKSSAPQETIFVTDFFANFETKPRDESYFRKHLIALPADYNKKLFRYRKRTKKYYFVSEEHEKMTDFYILYKHHSSAYQNFGVFPYFERNGIQIFDSGFLNHWYNWGLHFKNASSNLRKIKFQSHLSDLSENRLNSILQSQILDFAKTVNKKQIYLFWISRHNQKLT